MKVYKPLTPEERFMLRHKTMGPGTVKEMNLLCRLSGAHGWMKVEDDPDPKQPIRRRINKYLDEDDSDYEIVRY